MKKVIILLFFLLLIPGIYAVTLSSGETETVEGREIKVVSIQETKVVISVDGEKGILGKKEREVINGVEITVVDIFYSDEDSTVSFNSKLTYSCGDGSCGVNESPETCCSDCGCTGSEKCSQNSCIQPECLLDEDCNDSNPLTEDSCSDYKCKHKDVKCNEDAECDDGDIETEDFCSNGTCQNLPPICRTDSDCDDLNECTLDQCINNDCQFKTLENCEFEAPEREEEKEEEVIEFSRDSDPNFFQAFFRWLKNLF